MRLHMCLLIDETFLSLSTNLIVQWFAIFNALLLKVWSLYQQPQQHLGNWLETKSAVATATDLLNLAWLLRWGSAVCVSQALWVILMQVQDWEPLLWLGVHRTLSRICIKTQESNTLSPKIKSWKSRVQDPAILMICQDSRIKMAPGFNFEKPYRSWLATEACTPSGHISHRSAKTPVFSPRLKLPLKSF